MQSFWPNDGVESTRVQFWNLPAKKLINYLLANSDVL